MDVVLLVLIVGVPIGFALYFYWAWFRRRREPAEETGAMPVQTTNSTWTDNSGYSHIELFPDGNYKSFVPETDTEWMIGKHRITIKANFKVSFYADGQLERCVVSEDTTLSVFDVPVLICSGRLLEFHPNGNIRMMTLAPWQSRWIPWASKAWKYRGTAYDPCAKLGFSEDGTIASAETPQGQ